MDGGKVICWTAMDGLMYMMITVTIIVLIRIAVKDSLVAIIMMTMMNIGSKITVL